jgi:hypothetical protein
LFKIKFISLLIGFIFSIGCVAKRKVSKDAPQFQLTHYKIAKDICAGLSARQEEYLDGNGKRVTLKTEFVLSGTRETRSRSISAAGGGAASAAADENSTGASTAKRVPIPAELYTLNPDQAYDDYRSLFLCDKAKNVLHSSSEQDLEFEVVIPLPNSTNIVPPDAIREFLALATKPKEIVIANLARIKFNTLVQFASISNYLNIPVLKDYIYRKLFDLTAIDASQQARLLEEVPFVLQKANNYPVNFLDEDSLSKKIDSLFTYDILIVRSLSNASAEILHVISQRFENLVNNDVNQEQVKGYYTASSVIRNGLNSCLCHTDVGLIINPNGTYLRQFWPYDAETPFSGFTKEVVDVMLAEREPNFTNSKAASRKGNQPGEWRSYTTFDEVRFHTQKQVAGELPKEWLDGYFYNEAYVHYEAENILGIMQVNDTEKSREAALAFQNEFRERFGVTLPIKVYSKDQGNFQATSLRKELPKNKFELSLLPSLLLELSHNSKALQL